MPTHKVDENIQSENGQPENRQSENRPVFLFDSVCVLCDNAVQHVLKHELNSDMMFISIQSPKGRELALAHDIDPDNPETFIFFENGVAHLKSDGVIALSQHLRGVVRLLRFGAYIPKSLRDWSYEKIARNRYKIFGKKDQCIIPNADNRHRFVL